MKEACERENQLRKTEEEEHDERGEKKKKKKMKSEMRGMRGRCVCARGGYLQNHSRTRVAIYRGPSPAPYRFNFKLKFMNGLLPFCRIRLRTFSGPGRRDSSTRPRLLPSRRDAARYSLYSALAPSRTFI